jgi:hypothetical protein
MTTGSVPVGSSLSTEACVSRYGLQDVYGNVSEWVIERFICASNECGSATFVDGSPLSDLIVNHVDPTFVDNMIIDSPNYAVGDYGFDGVLGPCRDIDSDGVCDATMTEWAIQDKNHGASFMSFPMGLPIHNSFVFDFPSDLISTSALEIGPTSGITNSQLKNDAFILNTAAIEQASTSIGSMATGGGYKDERASGRYTFELLPLDDVLAIAASGGILDSDNVATTLTFTAKTPGADGNSISIGLISSTPPLAVNVSGSSIVVEVDNGVTDASDIQTAIQGNTQADNLVSVNITGLASNVFSAQTGEFLTGGLDAVDSRRDDIGFRCMAPLAPGFYDPDPEHTYSY